MIDAETLKRLRGDLTGSVTVPGDQGYDRLRKPFFYSGEPACIIQCETRSDVQRVVRFGRDSGLPISVRGGGHSWAGFGTNDGGVVIDLSPMADVDLVDRAHHVVRIGGGATWGWVAERLSPEGLAISSGDTASVGVGGLILGGGVGWKVRKYGLTLDNLVAAEVVTAAGEFVRASADEHPDLFWALRGGGGNFGIVTAFEVTAHPTTDVHFGTISYPLEEFAEVVAGWGAYMSSATEELTSTVLTMPAWSPGPRTVVITVCFDGDDPSAAERAIEPLTRLGTVSERAIERKPYGEVLETHGGGGEGDGPPPGIDAAVRSVFVPQVDTWLVAALHPSVELLDLLSLEIRSLGGAMARVPTEATAFAHRTQQALLTTAILGPAAAVAAARPDFDELAGRLAPFVSGAYVNFLSTATPEDVDAAYPDGTYRRLAVVKKAYDPENTFRLNHNIDPAGESA